MVVGELEVEALLDAEGSFSTYAEAFPGADESVWAPWRERAPELFDGDRWVLPFRSFLIRSADRTILVDTAVGPAGGDFLPEAQGWLPGELERLGAEPDTVFLTHVHVDHIGWSSAFPDVEFVAHRQSIALSEERGRPLPRATAVEGEAELGPGVVAFETPGHLAGHMSVRIGDGLVILGDVAVHSAQLADPDLAYVWDRGAVGTHAAGAAVHVRRPDPRRRPLPGGFGRVQDGVWTPLG